MNSERLPRASNVAALLFVLTAYAYFGSGGSFAFRRAAWDYPFTGFTEGYYARLADAFLHGRLDLRFDPDPRWQNVANAYDYGSRATQGLEWVHWDSSYYGGKFYLYFSAVPAVLFYIPFRLAAGAYPPDALVATFACAWAFLASVAFARRALAERRARVPFAVWILLLGFGNVIPFILADVRAYEVAITTGMAMTAMWAWALLRFFEWPSPRNAAWMGLWLALAIATRPNLLVLLLVAAVAVPRRKGLVAAVLAPLAIVAALLLVYNAARFGNPREFGMTYQLSYEPIWRHAPCSLCDVPEAIRFVNNVTHYVFWPPRWSHPFPFVDLQKSVLDPAVSFVGGAEQIGGIAPLSPLAFAGSLCTLGIAAMRGPRRHGVRAALLVAAAAWLALLGLSTCRWVTARYALDFMLLMSAASVVTIETVLAELVNLRTRIVAALLIAVAAYSVVTGLLLGFRGTDDAFARKHPMRFQKIWRVISPSP